MSSQARASSGQREISAPRFFEKTLNALFSRLRVLGMNNIQCTTRKEPTNWWALMLLHSASSCGDVPLFTEGLPLLFTLPTC